MEAIVLTDDQLTLLEKRSGPQVRQMGPWSSDGRFGYSNVPIAAVEKAAEALQDPDLMTALSGLEYTSERTMLFIGLLETFGTALIERVVAAYRGCSLAAGSAKPTDMALLAKFRRESSYRYLRIRPAEAPRAF